MFLVSSIAGWGFEDAWVGVDEDEVLSAFVAGWLIAV